MRVKLTIRTYYFGLLALLSIILGIVVSCSYTTAPRERERAYDRQVDDVTLNMGTALVRRFPQVGPLCNMFRDWTVIFTIDSLLVSEEMPIRFADRTVSCVTSKTALHLQHFNSYRFLPRPYSTMKQRCNMRLLS
jgi:hypothetical protein